LSIVYHLLGPIRNYEQVTKRTKGNPNVGKEHKTERGKENMIAISFKSQHKQNSYSQNKYKLLKSIVLLLLPELYT
jgi:hypothetical protein